MLLHTDKDFALLFAGVMQMCTDSSTATAAASAGPIEEGQQQQQQPLLPEIIVIESGQVEVQFPEDQLNDMRKWVARWNSEVNHKSRKGFMIDGMGRTSGNGIDGTARPADAGLVFMILVK